MNYSSNEKTTLYTMGAFGIQATELRSFEAITREYAQYKNAVQVKTIAKGKRKQTGTIVGYKPWFVLVSGHDLPKPQDAMMQVSDNAKMTRHTSFSPEYKIEADEFITALTAAGHEVLFDTRGLETAF